MNMEDKNILLSFMKFMQGVNNSKQYQELQYVLNNIGTSYACSIKSETIDEGIDSCKDIIHSFISSTPYRVEQVRKAHEKALTVFCESLKADYKKIFKDYGLLYE